MRSMGAESLIINGGDMKTNRFRNPAIVVVLPVILLVLLVFWALSQITQVHAQTTVPKSNLRTDVNYFEMPVCDEESLANRASHPLELTSCSALIEWQNKVADNLGIPVVTQDKKNKRGQLIKRGNFDTLVAKGELVPITSTKYMEVVMRKRSYNYAAPQVKEVLAGVSYEYYMNGGKRLKTLISLLRFHETRKEGSMHTRGLAADLTCINMTKEDIALLQGILRRYVQKNGRVQVAEESVEVYKRVNKRKVFVGYRVAAYHVVVFNASFMTPH